MSTRIRWFSAALAGLMLGAGAFAADSELNLSGKWSAPCRDISGGKWIEETFDFARGDHFRREQKIYTEKACPILGLYESRSYAGYYKLGIPVKDDPGVKSLDFTITEVSATAYGDKAVEEFNKSKLCKMTDWKQGQKRDITGFLCKGETVPAGTVVYDAVLREGDKLYFGDKSYFRDSSNIKARPTSVDRDTVFLKNAGIAE